MSTQTSESEPNEVQPKENTKPVNNGTKEHVVKIPVATKSLSRELRLDDEEDMVPVVAFKERRSIRTLASLEEIQTQHRAGKTHSRSQDYIVEISRAEIL